MALHKKSVKLVVSSTSDIRHRKSIVFWKFVISGETRSKVYSVLEENTRAF